MKSTTKLVLFNEDINQILIGKDENHIWLRMFNILNKAKFQESNIESVTTEYKDLLDKNAFWDIQFKFFLVRQNQEKYSRHSIADLYLYWQEGLPLGFKIDTFNRMLIYSQESKIEYGRYYYPILFVYKFLKQWNDNQITLSTWKNFNQILISKEIELLKLLNRDNDQFKTSIIKTLFDEYVNEIFIKYKSRATNAMLKAKDLAILEKLITTSDITKDEKKSLGKIFELQSWRSLSEDIDRCLQNTLSIEELDIHNNKNLSKQCALIQYYEYLKAPKEKKTETCIWFKNMPAEKEKRDELYEALKDIYDFIQNQCPNCNWVDFKLIFSEYGSKQEIIWTGEIQILRFLFSQTRSLLKFKPNQWEAVCSYFKPNSTERFRPSQFSNGTTYNNTTLKNLIDRLKTTLT